MNIELLMETFGEAGILALAGLLTGLIFGFSAEQSRFCLRSAIIEIQENRPGRVLAVWALAFATALLITQALISGGVTAISDSRWVSSAGSFSGAIAGGLLVGFGMMLARGCPSRLLVLGATGNLRSLVSLLVFATVVQATLFGALVPARTWISGLWMSEAENQHLLLAAGLPEASGLYVAIAVVLAALWLVMRSRLTATGAIAAAGVGIAVGLGWYLTATIAEYSFEPVAVGSVTIAKPTADAYRFVTTPDNFPDFGVALFPGVMIAAFLSAAVSGRLKLQGWSTPEAMIRSLSGAALMGFGSVVALGCTVGAGLTGASTFSATAFVALAAMIAGGMAGHAVLDRRTIEEPQVSEIGKPAAA